jgi:hypothetical protein
MVPLSIDFTSNFGTISTKGEFTVDLVLYSAELHLYSHISNYTAP